MSGPRLPIYKGAAGAQAEGTSRKSNPPADLGSRQRLSLNQAEALLPQREYLHTFLGDLGAVWERVRVVEAVASRPDALVLADADEWQAAGWGHHLGIEGYDRRGRTLWIESGTAGAQSGIPSLKGPGDLSSAVPPSTSGRVA